MYASAFALIPQGVFLNSTSASKKSSGSSADSHLCPQDAQASPRRNRWISAWSLRYQRCSDSNPSCNGFFAVHTCTSRQRGHHFCAPPLVVLTKVLLSEKCPRSCPVSVALGATLRGGRLQTGWMWRMLRSGSAYCSLGVRECERSLTSCSRSGRCQGLKRCHAGRLLLDEPERGH
jgi:hypothetical protein